MIITKDCDEFQRLLKKVEYLENVILASKYYCGCDPYKTEIIYSKTKTPQFKVGDWVCLEREGPLDNKGRIVNVLCIENNRVGIQIPELPYDQRYYEKKEDLRLMTSQEIESHLKKICDEMGYREGTKIRCMNKGNIRTLERPSDWFYSEYNDSFHGSTPASEWDNGYSNPLIYRQGKFAEIVPDKKKLPKTKTELINFITRYEDVRHGCLTGVPISDFFDEYED